MTKRAKEAIGLAVLVGIAAAVWYFNATHSAVPAGAVTAKAKYSPLPVESSRIRWDKLEASRRTEYKTTGRNPFSPIVPPTPEQLAKAAEEQRRQQELLQQQQHQQQAAAIQADPPKLPLKFFGYGNLPTRAGRLAFFTDGEDVFFAAEGETLQGRFRILHIGNASVDFEEISSGRRGSAPLEEQQAPSV